MTKVVCKKFLLHIMSLLTVPIVKDSDVLAGIYFIFLKNVLDQTVLKTIELPRLSNKSNSKRSGAK